MVLTEFEVSAGGGVEWKLLNAYFAIWRTENPNAVAYLTDEFYLGFNAWLSRAYNTINEPSKEMVFRFANIEDKTRFLLTWS